jgi:hypothetical protein
MIDLILTVVVAVLGCALLLTVVVIWSIKRHRDSRLCALKATRRLPSCCRRSPA